MPGRRTRAAAAWGCGVILGLLAGCATRGGAPPASPDVALRLLAPPVVRWEPGEARALGLALINVGGEPVAVPAPPGRFVAVSVSRPGEEGALCELAGAEDPAPGPELRVEGGGRVRFTLDLSGACGPLAPGRGAERVWRRARHRVRGRSAGPGGPDDAHRSDGAYGPLGPYEHYGGAGP